MKILLVGFQALSNSSYIITKELARELKMDSLLLSYGFEKMQKQLENISVSSYDYIFLFGDKTKQTKSLTLERIALNIKNNNEEILPKEKVARKTNIDIDKLATRLRKKYSIRVSNHAGTHFCNFAYFYLLTKRKEKNNVLLIHMTRFHKKLDIEKMKENIKILIEETTKL